MVGQEKAKIRQLRKLGITNFLTKCIFSHFVLIFLGYTPIVLPFNQQINFKMIAQTIAKLLKAENVSLPNLDDGYREINRKF